MAKEQDYQRRIVKFLESRGAYVVKVISASKSGVPDILACVNGRMVGIEVKTPTTRKTVSKLQQYNLEKITEAGGFAMMAVEVKEVDIALTFEGIL